MVTATENPVEQLSAVEENLEDLREDLQDDLNSDEKQTRLTALAAGIIDETSARPGDPYADRDTVGILTLQCRHINFSNGKATLSYTGKSDVEQKREVTDKALISTLKDACEGEGPQTEIFQYKGEDGTKSHINGEMLNDYLSDHGFTAKDIRKYHANELMAETLEDTRKNGPNLSEEDEPEETLKDEFKDALEEVSNLLGNEPSTIQSDYLLDGLKETWESDGKVEKKYSHRQLSKRVASRYLTNHIHSTIQ